MRLRKKPGVYRITGKYSHNINGYFTLYRIERQYSFFGWKYWLPEDSDDTYLELNQCRHWLRVLRQKHIYDYEPWIPIETK